MTLLADRCPPSELPERMERRDQDPELLDRALDALEGANRRLGGTRVVWRPLARALEARGPRSGEVRLLDVGAGGGDMGRELASRVRQRGLVPRLLLGDRHERTLRLARRRGERGRRDRGGRSVASGTVAAEKSGAARAGGGPRFLRLDAGDLPVRSGGVHLVVCAATLHHLERGQALRFLREAERVASLGWVVADLRRSWPSYLAVQLLAHTLWRNNPLPRCDAPRSVRRAYTPAEARGLVEEAGVEGARVRPAPPFRLAILGGAAARSGH